MLITKVVDDALIELGVLNPREEATPEEHEHGLRVLNRIISFYNAQKLAISVSKDLTLPKPDNGWLSSMKIGYSQYIDTQAPSFVDGAFYRISGVDKSIDKIPFSRYYEIPYKDTEGYPSMFAYQMVSESVGEIAFYPKPSNDLEIHLLASIPRIGRDKNTYQFSPADDVYFNYGTESLLVYRLAVELADSYQVQISSLLIEKMKEAENVVKAYNYKPKLLKSTYQKFRRRFWNNTGKYR